MSNVKEEFFDIQGPQEGRIRAHAVGTSSKVIDVSELSARNGFVTLIANVNCWYKYAAGSGTASATATSGVEQSWPLPAFSPDSHRIPAGATKIHIVAEEDDSLLWSRPSSPRVE